MALTRRIRLVVFTLLSLVLLGVLVYVTGPESAGGLGVKLTTPGPLSQAHAPMDAEEQCFDCHEQAGGITGGLLTPDSECLACHTALDQLIQAKRGFHAKILENFTGGDGETCRRCHSEHLGVDKSLVVWTAPEKPFEPARRDAATKEDFPHEVGTGFALNGAHADLKCDECHKLSLVSDDSTGKIQETFASEFQSYLGMGDTCAGCHQDPHVPSQGEDCAKCHSEVKWDDLPEFDHKETRFPLNGAHADPKVKCEDCHLETGESPPPPDVPAELPNFEPIVADERPRVFRGVGFGTVEQFKVTGDELPDCKACHESPHRESDNYLDCATCHSEDTFEEMRKDSPFDHEPFYPLEGGHADVACAKCHGEKEGEVGPLHLPKLETCRECHEDDYDEYHAGSFDREMEVAFHPSEEGCAQCHDVNTWKESTYKDEDHTPQANPSVAIPLAASHGVRCEYCHGTGRADLEPLVAVRENRKNFTKDRPYPRLPAQGRFSIGQLETDCESCHEDVHDGRLTLPDKDQTCATCHWFDSWHGSETKPLDRDGHAALGFPIRGKHDEIFDDCQACHGGKTAEGALREVALSEIKENPAESCNYCHHEVGDAAHQGKLGKDCAACHNESVWDPAEYTFEEHQQTRFPLTDAHAAVPCQVCHEPQSIPESEQPLAGQTIRFHPHTFDADPLRCTTCHEEDSPHGRQFRRQDCDRCHDEKVFVPSTYTKQRHLTDARFPLEDKHDTACVHCHQPPPGRPPKNAIYERTPRACALCHEDYHLGQFFEKGREGCSVCHTIKDWEPSRFDHDKARFALKGAHLLLECETCHPKIKRTFDGVTKETPHFFPLAGRECQDCHQNPHGDGAGEGK